MSERRPHSLSLNEEVHALRREVTEKLTAWETRLIAWEAQLGGWDRVISETLTDALEQGEAKAAERWQTQAQQLEQTRALWREREQSQLNRLSEAAKSAESLTGRLTNLAKRLEAQTAPWFLGWSRNWWQMLSLALSVSLIVSLMGTTIYWRYGPPARARDRLEAQLSTYQGLWNVMTEAERERIRKRRDQQSSDK